MSGLSENLMDYYSDKLLLDLKLREISIEYAKGRLTFEEFLKKSKKIKGEEQYE